MNGIALSYSGVHEIFQLALAAHELGELEGLHCSAVDLPGKWGAILSRRLSMPSARPLGWSELPPGRVREFPWPLLSHRLIQKALPRRKSEHLYTNDWFDRTIAHRLLRSDARVFVGGETCAAHSLAAAKQRGMTTILDCAGISNQFLEEQERVAAAKFAIDFKESRNSAAMLERKRRELELSDVVLCCSEFQRDILLTLNPKIKRTEVIPLWADVEFWAHGIDRRQFSVTKQPLKVLYAGSVSIRKGVPYLIEAVEPLKDEVSLTLVGSISNEMEKFLSRFRPHRRLAYVPKQDLRSLYGEHDIMVMPTLGDSFGFVIIEAMASGMAVIASRNAGAPIPSEEWRVPPHSAEAIRHRLMAYHADRNLLRYHGNVARTFALKFRPEKYRTHASSIFSEFLDI